MKKVKKNKKGAASSKKAVKKPSLIHNKHFVIGVILSVLILASLFFIFSVKPTGNVINGNAVAGTNFISDLFTQWGSGNLDINIAKYLFWIMLLMLIGDVLSVVGFPSNGFLRFAFALIVSFLATAFITPNEVYVMLISYSSLGLALGTVIPFMLMMFTSVMLAATDKVKQLTAGRLMLIVVLWLFWVGFLIYRMVMFWITNGFAAFATGGGIVLVAVFVASALILIFNKGFRRWLQNLGIETKTNRARMEQAERRIAIKSQKAAEEASRSNSNL